MPGRLKMTQDRIWRTRLQRHHNEWSIIYSE